MPELPEVEILARHLRPLLHGRTIRAVEVFRPKVLAPTPVPRFQAVLRGATFLDLTRRGKYLLFTLRARGSRAPFSLLGHLGMTGRMFLTPKGRPLPKHAAVVLDLGRNRFVYEDPRYFGRLTLDVRPVARLGPEPMAEAFTAELLAGALKRSRQAIKVKLLDQSLVAGIGNIYASESLFRAGLSPRRPANRLSRAQVEKLWQAIREVLTTAIECGSTIPLNFEAHPSDRLFYYGSAAGAADFYTERLGIYDRAGQPCGSCGTPIKRIVQAARSTFFCPHCQKS
jgi:formamidopyrimidine-DNA glycosylase